ncbi:Zn(II)2Cys6 transcription factor [Penicillium angulare]|uniref:Zn(II)2Cys6 transcription factor n=1 Tax=Penicillium angulare TaxID=116970 RepID=A0A9W9ESV2_9EURO|nr:Zn(II)2Cys6 transcription factor [Penicillium angulare]
MECVLAVAAGDLGKLGRESVELESLSNHHYARASAGLSAAITREMEASGGQEILAPAPRL